MKVYGNVDTKDVASFVLYAKPAGEVPDMTLYALYHDEQAVTAVTKKDLADMIGKAPIMVRYLDEDGAPTGSGAWPTWYGLITEMPYGVISIPHAEGESPAVGYTAEYNGQDPDNHGGTAYA